MGINLFVIVHYVAQACVIFMPLVRWKAVFDIYRWVIDYLLLRKDLQVRFDLSVNIACYFIQN
jgi:hypothetical protein